MFYILNMKISRISVPWSTIWSDPGAVVFCPHRDSTVPESCVLRMRRTSPDNSVWLLRLHAPALVLPAHNIILHCFRYQFREVRMSDLRIGGVPIAKLKVAELKAELEARELSKTGKKDELVARLISFMEVTASIFWLRVYQSHIVKCICSFHALST